MYIHTYTEHRYKCNGGAGGGGRGGAQEIWVYCESGGFELGAPLAETEPLVDRLKSLGLDSDSDDAPPPPLKI